MAFRIVFVESQANMQVKLNNLIVSNGEKETWIPVSDISMVVLDNIKTMVSARLMTVLAEYNIGLIVCNQEHLPFGYYSSYDNHSRISKYIWHQINHDTIFYDQLWGKIVKQKIENQSQCLEKLGLDESSVEMLRKYITEIEPGDLGNREAHAAKVYFNTMMGSSFSRGNENILMNSGLDYGYAIIRSFIARVCVGYGLNTQLGIHHRNEYNRFNLVDDIMEPLRPIVDYYVFYLLEHEGYFKVEHRRKLVNILNHKMIYKNKKMFVCNVIEEYVSGMATYIADEKYEPKFPEFAAYIGEESEI